MLSLKPNSILPAFVLLSLSFLVACGNTNSSSTNTGGATPTSGSNQPGNNGAQGSSSIATAPTNATFIYGSSGESIGGARVGSDGQLTALNMPTDALSGAIGWLPGTGGLVGSLATDSQGRFLYAISLQTSSFAIPSAAMDSAP